MFSWCLKFALFTAFQDLWPQICTYHCLYFIWLYNKFYYSLLENWLGKKWFEHFQSYRFCSRKAGDLAHVSLLVHPQKLGSHETVFVRSLLFAVQVWTELVARGPHWHQSSTMFFWMQQTVWNHRLIQFNAVLAWKKEGKRFYLKRETSNYDQL